MRLPSVLDGSVFADAELSGIRLDGDGFLLGGATVPVDAIVSPALRAAAIAAAAPGPGAVAVGRTAAWLHGADPAPPQPQQWAIDLAVARLTRSRVRHATERRFNRTDLVRVGDLVATTPLRTAFDLAREQPFDRVARETCARLVAAFTPHEIGYLSAAFPAAPGKIRAIARLQRLRATPTATSEPDTGLASAGQPAETRYTS